MPMCRLQKQYAFFKQNITELMEKYSDRIIVISANLEVTAFDTMADAYSFAVKNYGLGSFMVQKCTKDAVSVKRISNFNLKNV